MATRAEVEAILDCAIEVLEKQGFRASVGVGYPTWWGKGKIRHPSLWKKGSYLLAVRLHNWPSRWPPRRVLGIPASYELVSRARILGLKHPE